MDRKTHFVFHGFFAVSALFIIVVFGMWWFNIEHVPHNFTGIAHIADFILFGIGSYVIWHPMVMVLLCVAIAFYIKDLPHVVPEPGKKVAFITNFVPNSESIDLLLKALPAMVNADYPHDTWLLDEGDDPKVKELCRRLGVYHYSRRGKDHYNTDDGKFAAKTKGGNHNSWYDMYGNNYDYVAQIDTDFVPRRDFLTKTIGHFRDPTIAFVGTPQIYGNIDSFVARGAAEQSYIFYGSFLRGMSGMRTALLIGANHVIRVAALKSVNHYSAHITEDMLTGMKLHANGWRSVYVSEALAVGEGPEAWKSYFNQQMRWAYGCMDILLRHSLRLYKGMDVRRVLYYFILQQYYFRGLAMIMGLLGFVLYFAAGITTASLQADMFILLYGPCIAACGIVALWLRRYNIRPDKERGFMLAGKVICMAAWPIFFIAFLRVLRRKKLVYKVTPKGKFNGQTSQALLMFRPHLIVAGIGALCCVSALFTDRHSVGMLFWAGVTTLTMGLVPFAEKIYLGARWVKRACAKLFRLRRQSVVEAEALGD